jgi:hypothetical protein
MNIKERQLVFVVVRYSITAGLTFIPFWTSSGGWQFQGYLAQIDFPDYRST